MGWFADKVYVFYANMQAVRNRPERFTGNTGSPRIHRRDDEVTVGRNLYYLRLASCSMAALPPVGNGQGSVIDVNRGAEPKRDRTAARVLGSIRLHLHTSNVRAVLLRPSFEMESPHKGLQVAETIFIRAPQEERHDMLLFGHHEL